MQQRFTNTLSQLSYAVKTSLAFDEQTNNTSYKQQVRLLEDSNTPACPINVSAGYPYTEFEEITRVLESIIEKILLPGIKHALINHLKVVHTTDSKS